MDTSALRPPNNHLLNDDLIVGEVQCVRRANSAVLAEVKHLFGIVDYLSSESNSPTSTAETSLHNEKRKMNEVMETISLNRLQLIGSADGVTERSSSYSTIAELLELGKRIKRIKGREAQKRYRDKQEAFVSGLEEDVQNMRNEVKILELKRRQLSPVMEGAWDIVLGYFRLAHHRRQLTKDRLELVRGTMSSNVIYNSKFGLKSMVRSWFCLQWFGDVEEELENVNKATPNSMIASTRTSVTITHQTLTNVFPHLLCDSDLRLVGKLLGKRLVMCGSVCFVWCGTSERVSSVTTQSDMLTPMLQLLGNWEDASRVFENALISPDFQWRDL